MSGYKERARLHMKDLVDASGMTLAELHERCLSLGIVGLEPSALSRMVSGHRPVQVDKVARLFGVDPVHLVGPYPESASVPVWLTSAELADLHIESEGLVGDDAALTAAHICDMADRWHLWRSFGTPVNGFSVGADYYVPARPACEGEPFPVEW